METLLNNSVSITQISNGYLVTGFSNGAPTQTYAADAQTVVQTVANIFGITVTISVANTTPSAS